MAWSSPCDHEIIKKQKGNSRGESKFIPVPCVVYYLCSCYICHLNVIIDSVIWTTFWIVCNQFIVYLISKLYLWEKKIVGKKRKSLKIWTLPWEKERLLTKKTVNSPSENTDLLVSSAKTVPELHHHGEKRNSRKNFK